MPNKRLASLLILLALLASVAGNAIAQEATEEPEPLEASTATELTEETVLSEVIVQHPEGWVAIQDGTGAIIISNVDVMNATVDTIPDDALFGQVIFVGTNIIEGEEDVTATTVLEMIRPEEDAELPIEQLEEDDARTVAKIDRSTEDTDGIIYSMLLNDDIFVVVAVTANPGRVEEYEETLVNIIRGFELDINSSIPEEAAALYEGIPQSVNEDGFPVLGDPDAPAEIVEISSFDCPACGQFHALILPELIETIANGEARFVYVPIFGTGSLPGGMNAAQAALCAAEQDSFWTYHSALFSWQQYGNLAFIGERLTDGAEALSLDTAAFEECLAGEGKADVVTAALEYARSIPSFTGTPTILVNGEPVNTSVDAILAAVSGADDSEE